jgi:hypothetical protein
LPVKNKLSELRDEWLEFQLNIILYWGGINKWLHIKADVLSFLWEVNASIDIDTYTI